MRASFALLIVSSLLVTAVAQADSPHFTSATGSLDADGQLVISFKEAGLGANVNINFAASADATANYGCVNKGGKNPAATNKRTATGPVSGQANFSSGKNGSISQSLTLKPPPAPADFSCPGGQSLVLADVGYSNVTLKDTTTPVSAPVAGSFTKTFFAFK